MFTIEPGWAKAAVYEMLRGASTGSVWVQQPLEIGGDNYACLVTPEAPDRRRVLVSVRCPTLIAVGLQKSSAKLWGHAAGRAETLIEGWASSGCPELGSMGLVGEWGDLDGDYKVTVCDKCNRASCWQGVFLCDEAKGAGTRVASVEELRGLSLESEDYWEATR